MPVEAVSNPVLEWTAVGKISFRDNQSAGITPKVAFGLSTIHMYSKHLLNTHNVQDAGPERWELERERGGAHSSGLRKVTGKD